MVVLLLVVFLAAAGFVLVHVASSLQPVSLPQLVVDPTSVLVGRQYLGIVGLLACAVGDFVGILS